MSLKIKNCGSLLVVLLIALLIVTNVIVWWPTLFQFFVFDDFGLLAGAKEFSLERFLVGTMKNTFFRPISTFWLIYPLRIFFNLNPLYYHVVLLTFHILTSLLIFWCAYGIIKNKYISFLISFFWSIHFSRFGPLTWFAGIQDLSMTFFFFLSFGLYLSFQNEGKENLKYIFSIISFIFSLACKETAIILPFLLIFFEILNSYKKDLKIFSKVIPYIAISIFYLAIRNLFLDIFREDSYKFVIGKHSFINFIFYVLWSNILALANPLTLTPTLAFPNITIPGIHVIIIILIMNIFILYVSWIFFNKRLILFFIIWFIISISLFLLFPNRVDPYFLNLPLFGFLAIVCLTFWQLIIKHSPKIIVFGIILFLTISASLVVRIQYKECWLPFHAQFAEKTISFLKKKYTNLPPKTEIYFLNFTNSKVLAYDKLHSSQLALGIEIFFQHPIHLGINAHFLEGVNGIIENLKENTLRNRRDGVIILKIFPRQWTEKVFNGGRGEINDKIGQIECKTSSWRKFSNGSAEYGSGFTGDFEVYVNYSLICFPVPSKDRVEADISLEIEGERYCIGRWRDASGMDAYWMWGGMVPNTYIPTKDITGKLRARRIGSTLYGDFWDGAKWVNIGSRAVKNGTAYVSLTAFNSTSKKRVEVQFSNFTVVSGETLFSKYYSKEDSIILD